MALKRKAAPSQPTPVEDWVRDAPIALDIGIQPEPAPAPDLAGEIMRVRGLVESFIDAQVARLKASRDGQSIPPEVLRNSLTRGSGCLCAVAMNILAEETR